MSPVCVGILCIENPTDIYNTGIYLLKPPVRFCYTMVIMKDDKKYGGKDNTCNHLYTFVILCI